MIKNYKPRKPLHQPDPFENVESTNDPIPSTDEKQLKIRRAVKALSDEKRLLSEKTDHMDWDLTIRGEDESIIIKCKSSLTLTLTFPIDYDDRETARLAYKGIVFKFDNLMFLLMSWKYGGSVFRRYLIF